MAILIQMQLEHKAMMIRHPAAQRRLTLDMDDEIDRFSNLSFGIDERRLRVASHNEVGEPMQSLFC